MSVLVTHSAAVADHHDHPGHRHLGQRVEHVEDHGSAAQPVQGLGPGRAHPGALAGGQHHRRQLPTGDPRARPVGPGVGPDPVPVVPLARRLLGVGPDHHRRAPLPMAPGRRPLRSRGAQVMGLFFPRRPVRCDPVARPPTNAGKPTPQPARVRPPHPCPSSPPPSTRTRTPSGPTPAPCPTALDTVNEQLAAARAGGGERYVQRHRERGKLPARERIELLLDRDTAFLELCALAAWGTEYQVGASSVIGHRRGRGGRVPDRRQRPHRAGRRHEPLLLPQGRPRLGHRPPEPPAGRSTWSSRAGPTSRPRPSCSSPGAAAFRDLTRQLGRRPCPPWPWSSATPPPAAPTSRA